MSKTETAIKQAARKPWDRMPKEPLKAYEAWKVFRDWPPMDRTVMKVGRKLVIGRQIYTWAKQYEWEDRCIAWEANIDDEDRERRLNALDKMTFKHRKIVNGILKIGIKRLATMKPEEMDPRVTLQFLMEAMGLERKIIGIPDIIAEARIMSQNEEHVTNNVNVDLSFDVTPEILAAVQAAVAAGQISVDPGEVIDCEYVEHEPTADVGSNHHELPGSVDSEGDG